VGTAAYPSHIRQAHYGQLHEPVIVTEFWLDGSLRVSAEQQVGLLRQVVARSLPYRANSYDILRTIMRVDSTPAYSLYAKTGWAARDNPGIGWYIGYVEAGADTWLFALNLDTRAATDLPLRQRIAGRAASQGHPACRMNPPASSAAAGEATICTTSHGATMRSEEIKAVFDQQAASYDERWARTAPIRGALHFLLEAVFAPLPAEARVLCIGAGTGEEILHLAQCRPGWTFTAVEPSGAMLHVLRDKAIRAGIEQRCQFHEGYLETLPEQAPFDAATSLLVSQFILECDARIGFFRDIAARLGPGALLASSDLAADVTTPAYAALLETWLNMMTLAGIPAAGLEQMRAAYDRDVAILPPEQVASIIEAGGFACPVPFYQAGLIHAWYARRADAP